MPVGDTTHVDTHAITGTVESVPEIIKESKAGYRTTEFWLTILASLLVLFDGIPLPEKYEGAVSAALVAVYALSRGLAKQGVPDIEPVDRSA